MTQTPLSVIGGYLGAGKTTLINRLLTAQHGRRLAVLVNDFGAINIDAALLQSASEDTIELTNGCVCCTRSGDLFFAIGDLLDRTPRPDHILIEASGIADPAKIAAVAIAEKDLAYSGILSVVDGLNIETQLADSRIGEQVRGQLACADLLVLGKVKDDGLRLRATLERMGFDRCVHADALDIVLATLFGGDLHAPKPGGPEHPTYVQWSDTDPQPLAKGAIIDRLKAAPNGLLRLKAILPIPDGGFWEVHLVGGHWDIQEKQDGPRTGLVAIGLDDQVTRETIQDWWRSGARLNDY